MRLIKINARISSHLIFPFLALLLGACQPGIKEQELSELKTKNAEMLVKMVDQQKEIHLQQTQIDSLKTIIHELDQQLAKLNDRPPVLSEDQKAIRRMVNNMHNSWKELVIKKDPQIILDYFLPMFMANHIDINSEKKGHVAAYTDLDYEKYLEDIISRKGFSVEFGDVRFLDISIKDHEFFNVAYKCRMRQYKKDVLTETSMVMVTITGRKITDSWKIANYSVVSFEFRER